MKQNIKSAIRLTLACMFFFMGMYTFLIYAGAQLAPAKGKAETVVVNGRVVGYKLIGQKFTDDKYFQGRPSAVDYNAAGSGGSNKGPSNADYLLQVQARIDSFVAHNPGIERKAIPSDLVTASGGGLDPDISVPAALVQVKRIAGIRNFPADQVTALVNEHIEKPLAGLFGTARVNVLKLNIALERLSK